MQFRQSNVAGKAWECIEDAHEKDFFNEYRSRAMSFPAMLLQSGLAQSFGLLYAKKGKKDNLEKAYALYYTHIFEIVKISGIGFENKSEDEFYKEILTAEFSEYRYLTRLVLDVVIWLKRLCQGVKDVGEVIE